MNEEEFRVYIWFYGLLFWEIEFDDVGILFYVDMGMEFENLVKEGIILREFEDGDFEEIIYEFFFELLWVDELV